MAPNPETSSSAAPSLSTPAPDSLPLSSQPAPSAGVSIDAVPADEQGALVDASAKDLEEGVPDASGPAPAGNDDDGSSSDCGHTHFSKRSPWLRAALLGAQDGLISVASLMIGVGAVMEDRNTMVISGLAGLVAGACSMAIGEYVSVYGQRDIEEADILKERAEFAKGPEAVANELEELTQIYVSRGLRYELARQVAEELSAVDPIRAHARDELGIDMDDMSNPIQAALASAVCFVVGAIVPLLSAAFIMTYWIRVLVVLIVSTLMFIVFGALGAWLGGAKLLKASLRTTIGGLIAIAITYGILRAFGTNSAL